MVRISTPAIVCALSMASLIERTVQSMLATMPLRRPRHGTMPDAQDGDAVGRVDLGDDGADLGGPDVEADDDLALRELRSSSRSAIACPARPGQIFGAFAVAVVTGLSRMAGISATGLSSSPGTLDAPCAPVNPAPRRQGRPLRAILPVVSFLALTPLGLATGCGGTTSSLSGDGGPGSGDGGDRLEAGVTGDGSGSEASTGVSADQAATDAANAYCNRAQACAPAYVTFGYGTVARVRDRLQGAAARDDGLPRDEHDARADRGVRDGLPASVVRGPAGAQGARGRAGACPATLAAGEACGTDSQCVGTRCRVAPDAVCGTCTTPAPAGASCGVDDDCQPAMKCVNSTCTVYGNEGAACSATQPCRPDLGCVGSVCGTPSAAGTTCSDSTQCDQIHGDFCNPATTRCEAIGFAHAGGMCGLVAGMLVTCTGPGGFCSGANVSPYVGTCVPSANDGASCDIDAGPLCDEVSVCVSGTCQPIDPSTCK